MSVRPLVDRVQVRPASRPEPLAGQSWPSGRTFDTPNLNSTLWNETRTKTPKTKSETPQEYRVLDRTIQIQYSWLFFLFFLKQADQQTVQDRLQRASPSRWAASTTCLLTWSFTTCWKPLTPTTRSVCVHQESSGFEIDRVDPRFFFRSLLKKTDQLSYGFCL